ncbi:lauroyl-Kdo(2)-lipid IV(A) myristoyltransferase [Klebsiella variicola subsp. variicola]|nr:lauroyl-Kdo(2)-lipid IV(A) myristoyltransferase [Klebsiella variicola subsp. variicola]
METKKNNIEFIPKFEKSFLLPRYWGAWLGVFAFAGIALTPPSFRDPILGKLGRFVGRLAKARGAGRRLICSTVFRKKASTNGKRSSTPCMPRRRGRWVMMAELGLRDPQKILARVDWQGKEIIDEMQRNNEKVIFLVPHAWGVDIPAMLMASGGQKMAAMFHNQGNPVFDYVWNTVRRRFGGRMHARNDGIKPFIQSVRQGYWGYYLPDQDHGAEHSEFVDFFATYKATLPAIGRLMKVCRARVVPLFPVYDGQTHRLTVLVRPPMDDLLDADDTTIARRMNEEVEVFVKPHTEQYTWILKLLKTRKPGEIEALQTQRAVPKEVV